jgi:hypothetical protein
MNRSIGDWKAEDGSDSMGTEGADMKHNGHGIKRLDCAGIVARQQSQKTALGAPALKDVLPIKTFTVASLWEFKGKARTMN